MRLEFRLPRILRPIGGALIVASLLAAGFFFLSAQGRAASEPPIEFNHQVMVQAGIPCLFCHTDATRSPAAGIPSVEKCMGCHDSIATGSPVIQTVADYWRRSEPIPWPRVNQLPRFVYFSHRVHVVAGGLNCERCHGDVGQMAEAQPVVKMNMGWCLDCHSQQPNRDQLRDCIVCHQ
jgi:hypothetical protein